MKAAELQEVSNKDVVVFLKVEPRRQKKLSFHLLVQNQQWKHQNIVKSVQS